MRNIQSILITFITVIVLQSCQKEVDFDPGVINPSGPGAVTGNMKAKIDGAQWVANAAAYADRRNGRIAIIGISTDRKVMAINIADSGVHKYSLHGASVNFAGYQDSTMTDFSILATDESDDISLAGGEVNITSIDTVKKKISGTFTVRVYRASDGMKKNITEGSFTDISYTTAGSPTLPPTTTGVDTFRVKVNGTAYVMPSIFVARVLGTIRIQASTATSAPGVTLSVPQTVMPGSYQFDFFSDYAGAYNPDVSGLNGQAADGGSLVILEHNITTKRLRGNFNFVARSLSNTSQTSTLTEGYFSIKYQ